MAIRLQITIEDADKAFILLNLLKELPFVEIEKSEVENAVVLTGKRQQNLEELFGIWEGREITL